MLEMLPSEVRAFYERAEKDYEGFWEDAALNAASDVHWFKKWDKVFEWEYPTFRWYKGGITNISYSCLDEKVKQGKGSKIAFVAESGDTGRMASVTYVQLLDLVKKYASALRALGVKRVTE